MKIDNSGYITKCILLIISGGLIAFFPQIITWMFYIIGGIIVVSCILMMFTSFGSGDGGLLSSSSIVGILIGVGVMFLPKILTLGITIVGGCIFLVLGIVRIIKALSAENSQSNRILSGIIGCILVLTAIILFVNPFSAASAARVIVGLIMIVYGLFNGYVAYEISRRNSGYTSSSPDIIDVSDFSVHDDK
ncbi:MAG: DUF308 domain-containing protein [Ruminococcus sp.]|nr:DUF308 domain-containing protein [Ruminococcus sp.]HRR75312.1 DUF308 domain-containing protein [Ruminococcus sp.]